MLWSASPRFCRSASRSLRLTRAAGAGARTASTGSLLAAALYATPSWGRSPAMDLSARATAASAAEMTVTTPSFSPPSCYRLVSAVIGRGGGRRGGRGCSIYADKHAASRTV